MIRDTGAEYLTPAIKEMAKIRASLADVESRMPADSSAVQGARERYGVFAPAAFALIHPSSRVCERITDEDIDRVTAYDIRAALRDLHFTPEQTAVAASGMRFRSDFDFPPRLFTDQS